MIENPKWSVHFRSPDSLNFAIYVGCFFDIIQKSPGFSWPDKGSLYMLHSTKEVQSDKWAEWWNSLLKARYEHLLNRPRTERIKDLYEPPNFSALDVELRDCCEVAWPHFLTWWNMTAGGRNALSFHEMVQVKEFRERVSAYTGELKAFTLNIDYIYTDLPNVIDTPADYVVSTPDMLVTYDKEWWLAKLRPFQVEEN